MSDPQLNEIVLSLVDANIRTAWKILEYAYELTRGNLARRVEIQLLSSAIKVDVELLDGAWRYLVSRELMIMHGTGALRLTGAGMDAIHRRARHAEFIGIDPSQAHEFNLNQVFNSSVGAVQNGTQNTAEVSQ